MRMTIESTGQIVQLEGVSARIWRGRTDSGIDCLLYVHRVQVADGEHEEFAAELIEKALPERVE